MRFSFRLLLICGSMFAIGLFAYEWLSRPDWPKVVFEARRELGSMEAGLSIEEFGEKLYSKGLVEHASPSFFKDFTYKWTLQQGGDKPYYIVDATFFPFKGSSGKYSGSKLRYVTINRVDENSGKWKTIWSQEYAAKGTFDWHPIRIH